jgi:hypothetical protein
MRGEHGHRREAQAHDNPRASVYRDGREQNVPDDGLVVDSDKGQAIRAVRAEDVDQVGLVSAFKGEFVDEADGGLVFQAFFANQWHRPRRGKGRSARRINRMACSSHVCR